MKELHCQCLHEIENNLPRTKFCFMACLDQRKILHERSINTVPEVDHTTLEEQKKEKLKNQKIPKNKFF
jgi:hypothetical protein